MAAVRPKRPTQVAGLHFFNPVHRMELVEVVRRPTPVNHRTSDATIARLVAFVRALGKTPIVTSDSPGFLVNRVLFPYFGEAVLMVAEGYDVAKMDKQVRRFGMPMGPLQLLDQVGLDVALHVAKSLEGILPGVAPVVEQLSEWSTTVTLARNRDSDSITTRKANAVDAAAVAGRRTESRASRLGNDFLDDGLTSIQRRLVYPMLAEAIRCHEEGSCQGSLGDRFGDGSGHRIRSASRRTACTSSMQSACDQCWEI